MNTNTLLPKTPKEIERETDDAIAARSRRIKLDHWLDDQRVEQSLREVWDEH